MTRKKRGRLGPMRHMARPIVGPLTEGFTVGSWCPTPDGSGPVEAVGVSFHLDDDLGEATLRLKSPSAVDAMIQALLRHKRDVWPEVP